MASYNYSSGTGAPAFTFPVQTVNGGLQSGPPPPAYQAPLVVGQSNKGSSFNKKNTTWLSVLLIISGVVAILASAIGLRSFAAIAEIGIGLWCGLMLIATGSVAIAAGHFLTIQLLRGTVATASVSVVFTFSQLVVASIALGQDLSHYHGCHQFCYSSSSEYPCFCDYNDWESLAISSQSLLVTSSVVGFTFSLWLLTIASIKLRAVNKPQFRIAYAAMPYQTQLQQQAMVANQQVQPIILLSNNQTQPTVLMNNQQSGSFPFVMHGIQQSQPTVVFANQPQESVTVNIQTQPTVSSNSENNYERLNQSHNNSSDGQTGREGKERTDM